MNGAGILEQLLDEVRALRAELAELRATRPSRHVSIADYAAARSLSVSAVRAAVRAGRLPSIRAGRAIRVPADVEIAPVERKSESTTAAAERRLGLVHGGKR